MCNLHLYCGVILAHPGKQVLQNTAADANLRPVHPMGSVKNADSSERSRQHEQDLLTKRKETNSGGF